MRLTKVFCIIAAAILLLFIKPAFGDRIKTEHLDVDYTDESEVYVELNFGIGNLWIEPGSGDKLALITGEYDERDFEYDFDYKKKGGSGDLYLEVSSIRNRWKGHSSDGNDWHMVLSDRVPLELNIDIGAADCDLDFTGLKIARLDLDIGAASCETRFDTPNPVKLEKLFVDAGASSVEMSGLGNANFRRLEFDGGVGSYELDFSGKFDFDCDADISVGLGSVELTFPDNVGIRIYADEGFLSSVDIPSKYFDEVDEGEWESDNWESAKGHIEITLDVGLGSAEIHIR